MYMYCQGVVTFVDIWATILLVCKCDKCDRQRNHKYHLCSVARKLHPKLSVTKTQFYQFACDGVAELCILFLRSDWLYYVMCQTHTLKSVLLTCSKIIAGVLDCWGKRKEHSVKSLEHKEFLLLIIIKCKIHRVYDCHVCMLY